LSDQKLKIKKKRVVSRKKGKVEEQEMEQEVNVNEY
jgi:hypothetical protein